LINESVSILRQSVPKGIRLAEVQAALEEVQGVSKIHDLHVWTVTSGVFTLSVHAVIDGEQESQRVLNDMENTLKDRFQIEHTTIQLETEDRTDKEFQAF
jgi:cobalt-zinc-cadmium efflux system protein